MITFGLFEEKMWTFRIFASTSCVIRSFDHVDFTTWVRILFIFFYQKQGSIFFYPKRGLYYGWFVAKVWGEGGACTIITQRIFNYRKNIWESTKKWPISAGRVGLSVRDEYPGRHTNCPLSTNLAVLFLKFGWKFENLVNGVYEPEVLSAPE